MSQPDQILEAAWHELATTKDQSVFVRNLRTVAGLRPTLLGPQMSGRALDWLARIDHLVYQRTRPGAYSLAVRGVRGLAWLSLLCLVWPVVCGFLLWAALAVKGSAQGWETALAVAAALYCARLGHELGHLVFGAPTFHLRGIYASFNLGELRLEMGVRPQSVRASQFIRMQLGGSIVNLLLALVAVVVALLATWTGTFVLVFLATNLAIGGGNLLPIKALHTDGYHAYRTWRASQVPTSCVVVKGGQA